MTIKFIPVTAGNKIVYVNLDRIAMIKEQYNHMTKESFCTLHQTFNTDECPIAVKDTLEEIIKLAHME